MSSPWAEYSGIWTFGEAGADFGWINDSQLQFDFTGEEIALLVREGDYVAWLYTTLDGEPANVLPKDQDGRAYLTLTSATRQPNLRLVTLASNLSHGTHRLEISVKELVPDELEARWALAGFAVSQGDAAESWERQIFAGSIASLVASLALLVTAPFAVLASFIESSRVTPQLSRHRAATRYRRVGIASLDDWHVAHLG